VGASITQGRTWLQRLSAGLIVAAGLGWPLVTDIGAPAPRRSFHAPEVVAESPRDGIEERLAAEALRRMPELGEEGAACLASVIVEEASAAGLDPVLVFAIIEVESSWEPEAVSHRGALGLMQLRPGTLESEARDGGFALGDAQDPVLNVRAGVRYFRRMMRAFGNTDLALVAYNAGPTRLSSYLRAVGEVPDVLLSYPRRVRREERRLREDLHMPAQEVLATNVRR